MPATGHFDALALFADSDHNSSRLRHACEAAGLDVVDVSAETGVAPRTGLAWRVPVGMATELHLRGVQLALSAPTAEWFTTLPRDVTGRGLASVTVAELLAGDVALRDVRLVKLAEAKLRSFSAMAVDGLEPAQDAVRRAGLPASTLLLVADTYLDCASEYRSFCVGRKVVALSPYLVEGESWSEALTQHRASFHVEAGEYVANVLSKLGNDAVPPACVLDVARLEDGRYALLEANTTWGAGLYGCEPAAVLQAVLAANGPASASWRWRSDPGLAEIVRTRRDR